MILPVIFNRGRCVYQSAYLSGEKIGTRDGEKLLTCNSLSLNGKAASEVPASWFQAGARAGAVIAAAGDSFPPEDFLPPWSIVF